MVPGHDETDAALLRLVLECARPTLRFRMLFSAPERQLLGFAINTFMSQRQQNMLLNELDRRYASGGLGLKGMAQNPVELRRQIDGQAGSRA